MKMSQTVIVTVLLLIAMGQSLSLNHNTDFQDLSKAHIVGGWSEVHPVEKGKLSDDLKEIDDFVRKYSPDVKDKDLLEYQMQVVSGLNYRFFYGNVDASGNKSGVVKKLVWSQSWLNHLVLRD